MVVWSGGGWTGVVGCGVVVFGCLGEGGVTDNLTRSKREPLLSPTPPRSAMVATGEKRTESPEGARKGEGRRVGGRQWHIV